MRRRLHFIVFLTILVAVCGLSYVAAQAGTDITISFDDVSLTIFVAGAGPVSLRGLTLGYIDQSSSLSEQIILEQIPEFQRIPFDNIPAPMCFRIQVTGKESPLPSECKTITVISEEIPDYERFWYSNANFEAITVIREPDNQFIDICAPPQCHLVYIPSELPIAQPQNPTFTPTPITPPESQANPSATPLSGDNVTAIPAIQPTAQPVTPPPAGDYVLYNFDGSQQGWMLGLPGEWIAGRGVSTEAGHLKLQVAYPGGDYQDAGASVMSLNLSNWLAYKGIRLFLYSPAELKGALAKIYVKAGHDCTWYESPDFPLTSGEWTPLALDFDQMHMPSDKRVDDSTPDLSNICEMGIKVGDQQSQIQNGTLLLDNVTLLAQPAVLSSGVGITVIESAPINVRSGPDAGNPIVGILQPGEAATAYARNEFGNWLRIDPFDEKWVFSDLVQAKGYIASLPIASTDQAVACLPAPSPLPDTELLYSFEQGSEHWVRQVIWKAGQGGTASVPGTASDGQFALQLHATYSGGGNWTEAGMYVQPVNQCDWSPYTTLLVDVYVPAGLQGGIAQVYIKTGDKWLWTQSSDNYLNAGGWTTLSITLASLRSVDGRSGPDLTALHELGVKVGTSQSAYDGSIFVDNIRLTGLK